MTQTEYIAGVCNIGQEEIARRRNTGWFALIISLALLVILVWTRVDPLWRALVIFPATVSATCFLQAYFGFCTGFARKGVFNFGSVGTMHAITDESSKAKDAKRGKRITLYAILIGVLVAIVAVIA